MPTVFVAGALANKHLQGGEAWVRLSWVLGLRMLGFDAWLVEQISAEAAHPEAVAYFEEVVGSFGLSSTAVLLRDTGDALAGPGFDAASEAAADAEALLNISGHLAYRPLFDRFRRKVLVDIDPGFTQYWHASGNPGARVEDHDVHFTIGANIGTRGCPIPTSGIEWRATRPPVILSEWPAVGDGRDTFTTIASWRGPYGPLEVDGRRFGLKVHEFRKFIDLPRRLSRPFELALDIDPADNADREALEEAGWKLVDPKLVARDPDSFRSYVQASGAEFSVAKGVYVDTASGWFSDRSAHYLASGRPVLIQDTGFGRDLPVGEGLLSFRSLDEAAEGGTRIADDYDRHARAARDIAEEYFDSKKVLADVMEEVLA